MNNKSFREKLADSLNNTAFVLESIVKLIIIAGLLYLIYACTF